jgi:hypothetical protein
MENQGRFLLAGIVAVPAAFSLALLFNSLWIGYTAAFITAVIWLVLLDRYFMAALESRVIVRSLIGLLVAAQAVAAVYQYNHTERHTDTLQTIRTTIVEAISHLEMERDLQAVLRHFYMEPNRAGTTLEESFRDLFEDRMADGNTFLHKPPGGDEDLSFIYEIASPDSIILSVSATYTPGMDAAYNNRTGRTGMYEARTTLTKNGVRYERQN